MSETFRVRFLNTAGQCCGRKPMQYKRPTPFQFCPRCDTAYDPAGRQIPNWAWKLEGDHFVPAHPNADYVEKARAIGAAI